MTANFHLATVLQVVRFGILGVISNLLLYLLYLVLTGTWMGHKSAMTLLFALGVIQTFAFNKRWTFGHEGFFGTSFSKYVIIYSIAYVLNLGALFFLVDKLGYSHQVVQGVMILSLALILFLLQKFWVFRSPAVAATRA